MQRHYPPRLNTLPVILSHHHRTAIVTLALSVHAPPANVGHFFRRDRQAAPGAEGHDMHDHSGMGKGHFARISLTRLNMLSICQE